ncbi:MAG: phosphoribosylformylglycinamidine synthase subunit PurQ [Acidimicrobiales bacterium]|nr:MAG: phosphoribosylformylglycinamidine synthase subunit PurQ [Acidimicrobiales bacterium]
MRPKIAVVRFPGTNCEFDVARALERLGASAVIVWHDQKIDGDFDGVVLPGGFAHGDYLRPGAIARFSKVMESVRDMAEAGRPILGICNGFQILCEAGLLPGVLHKNENLRFICRPVDVRVDSTRTAVTIGLSLGEVLRIPINHFEGNYRCSRDELEALRRGDRIVLRYVDNPNGSTDSIAGVCNEAGNVVGLMPHPERASDELLGGTDGRKLLSAFLRWTARNQANDDIGAV